jgi:FixJ family two-component response regulator
MAGQQRTVFILDDDDAVRSALKFALEIEGYRVAAFANLLDFLAQPRSTWDCLIIDHRLPVVSGLDLVEHLQKAAPAPRSILITSNPNAALRARAGAAGVPIVEKPLQSDELIAAISRIIG